MAVLFLAVHPFWHRRHSNIYGGKEIIVPILQVGQWKQELLINDILALSPKGIVKCWLNAHDFENTTYFSFNFVIMNIFFTPTPRSCGCQILGLTCPHWLWAVKWFHTLLVRDIHEPQCLPALLNPPIHPLWGKIDVHTFSIWSQAPIQLSFYAHRNTRRWLEAEGFVIRHRSFLKPVWVIPLFSLLPTQPIRESTSALRPGEGSSLSDGGGRASSTTHCVSSSL